MTHCAYYIDTLVIDTYPSASHTGAPITVMKKGSVERPGFLSFWGLKAVRVRVAVNGVDGNLSSKQS